nr:hypothetical protein [Alloyangia pacifica]
MIDASSGATTPYPMALETTSKNSLKHDVRQVQGAVVRGHPGNLGGGQGAIARQRQVIAAVGAERQNILRAGSIGFGHARGAVFRNAEALP